MNVSEPKDVSKLLKGNLKHGESLGARKGETMEHVRHRKEEITEKLKEMYPEIEKHGIALSAEFSHEKEAWLIHLARGEHELVTHLDRKDADACLEGIECVHLGVQVGQFVSNFEEDEE